MKFIAKMYQRGLTLFEALLVMFVGAIVVGGVIVLYNTVQNQVKASNLLTGVQQIAAGIHSTYLSTGQYTSTVSTVAPTVAPTGTSPNWATGQTPFTTATTGWSAAQYTNTGTQTQFTILVTALPASACSALASGAIAGGAVAACSSNAVQGIATTCTTTDPGQAAAGCTASTSVNSVIIVYN